MRTFTCRSTFLYDLFKGPDGKKEATESPNIEKYKDRAQRMNARYVSIFLIHYIIYNSLLCYL